MAFRNVLGLVTFRGTLRDRSVEPYLRLFQTIRQRSRIRGVLLDISSGGGEHIASTDLYLAVKRLNQIKPVFVSIGAIGASGAYLAALGARRIFAYPESGVGSIGVIMPHLAVRDLLNRLGISVELLHAGRHKDAYQGYRPLTDEERVKLTAIIQHGYQTFVETVARERQRPVEEIRNLATGEYWTGAEALRLGLVDALNDREGALEELSRLTGVPVRRTVRLAPPRPFLERLFSGSGTFAAEALTRGVRDSLEDLILTGWLRGRL